MTSSKYLIAFLTVVTAVQDVQAFEIASSLRGPTRPNIILIMADDMGFSDLGCYGGEICTPNLDRLAANGLRFTQFYNAARCCPTRASLLTGLHPAQAGMRWMNGKRGQKDYYGALSNQTVTIAEALKPAGYATYMAGKWHVTGHDRARSSEEKSDWPCQRGFDHFYGTLNGAGSYFNPPTLTVDNESIEAQGKDYYYTDAVSDRSVQFIHTHHQVKSDQPFFLYVAYTAPHAPLHAPEEMIAKYRGRYLKGWDVLRKERYTRLVDMGIIDKRWICSPIDPAMFSWEELNPSKQEEMDLRMAVYAAQVEIMDRGIGRIVDILEQINQLDNTLIFFLSDNGASQEGGLWGRDNGTGHIGTSESSSQYGLPWANVSNTPFRHYKRWIHEGGVATPLVVHWPRGIEAKGELRHQLGHINDIMATCVDVAEVVYPTHHQGQRIIPCEGLSLKPVFANKNRTYPTIGWEHEGNRGVRKGKWKLVALRGEACELYDMTKDRTELHNLADRFPEKVEELEKEYRAWAGRCGIEPWKWPIERNMMPLPAR